MLHIRTYIFCLLLCFITGLSAQAADPQTTPSSPPQNTPAGISLLPPGTASIVPPSTVAPAVRIGVLDINQVSTDSSVGKAAQAQLKSLQAKLQKQIDAKRKQLDKQKAELERLRATIPPFQLEAKAKEFQKKVEDFQKVGMAAEKELATAQEKQTRALFDRISQVAVELSKEKGVSALVIHKELLYLGPGVERIDLTTDLIKRMDVKGATP